MSFLYHALKMQKVASNKNAFASHAYNFQFFYFILLLLLLLFHKVKRQCVSERDAYFLTVKTKQICLLDFKIL